MHTHTYMYIRTHAYIYLHIYILTYIRRLGLLLRIAYMIVVLDKVHEAGAEVYEGESSDEEGESCIDTKKDQ
jgi:hypothetical protein